MKAKDTIGAEIAKRVLTVLLTGIGVTGVVLWTQARPELQRAVDKLDRTTMAWLSLLQLLLIGLLSWWVRVLKKQSDKPLTQGLEFQKTSGCYWDPKEGHNICTRCLAAGQKIGLWQKTEKGPFRCFACHQAYPETA
jgi:hypothetical protein